MGGGSNEGRCCACGGRPPAVPASPPLLCYAAKFAQAAKISPKPSGRFELPSTCASVETSALRRNGSLGEHFSAPDFSAFRRLCRTSWLCRQICASREDFEHHAALVINVSGFALRH